MKRLILFFTLFASTSLLSAETLTVDLSEALEMAYQRNLQIVSSRLDSDKLDTDRKELYNFLMPRFSAGSSLKRDIYSIPKLDEDDSVIYKTNDDSSYILDDAGDPVPETEMVSYEDAWNLGFSVSGSLNIHPANFLSIAEKEMQYQSGLLSLDQVKNSVSRDIKKTFYHLLFLINRMEVLESKRVTAERRYEQISDQYDLGLESELNLLQAQADLESLKPEATLLNKQYVVELAQFKYYLGIDQETELVIQGEIPNPDDIPQLTELQDSDVTESPEILLLRDQIEQTAFSKTRTAVGNMVPGIQLSASYSAGINALFSDETNWSGEDDDWNQSGSFTISMSLPVSEWIPSSSSWQALGTIDYNLEKLDIRMRETIAQKQLELKSLLLTLEVSRQTIDAFKLNIKLAERTCILIQDGYENGMEDLASVKDSEEKLLQAQVNLLGEQYQYLSHILDLEYLIGREIIRLDQ